MKINKDVINELRPTYKIANSKKLNLKDPLHGIKLI